MAKTDHARCPLRAGCRQGRQSPEWLVGTGFRGWLSGYLTDDTSRWGETWAEYEAALGPKWVEPVVRELALWVREVVHSSARPLEPTSALCDRFCRDECLAISMIAACQHDACPAAKDCAVALLGQPDVASVVARARSFAMALAAADAVLPDTCPAQDGRMAAQHSITFC
jgi:hypothetical protein